MPGTLRPSTLRPSTAPSSARTVDRPATGADRARGPRRKAGRLRPAGWSPGTSTLLAAWVAGAAIARLTGASAVILLLTFGAIACTFEIVSGWWAARSVHVDSVTAPPVVTIGESCRLLVALDTPGGARAVERRRVSVVLDDGSTVSVDDAMPGRDSNATGLPAATAARFVAPGLIDRLTVRVEDRRAGWADLVATIHRGRDRHAPCRPGGPRPVGHGRASRGHRRGCQRSDARGNHVGEIDGIRPWRQGDSTNSVHWASSLRTDELIVHDRLTTADERWIVDLDAPAAGGADAASVRWTLDEALRHGHAVSVRTADGSLHPVVDDEAAARWSAVAAQTQADAHRGHDGSVRQRRGGILQRDVTLRVPAVETETAIGAVARWSAAAAAFASMAMLIGAVDRSPTLVAVVLGAVALGAVTSLWVARRAGKRPLIMQAAIVLAIGVALLAIVAQFSDVDGLLAALRGPLPDVLMLLVVLHGFEAIDRRTLRAHLAITFVLACYGAGLRIDGALGWWLVAWGTPFVVALVTTARRADHRRARLLDTQRPVVVSGAAIAKLAGSLVAMGVATLAVLSLIPIPDGPARLGLPALSVDVAVGRSPGGPALPDGSAHRKRPVRHQPGPVARSATSSATQASPRRSTRACAATSATSW